MSTATQEKQVKVNVKEAFTLWKNTSKDGKTTYFTGVSRTGWKLVGFYNGKKKNPNEPDLRIYAQTEEGKAGDELAALWVKESKAGKKYLTGKLTDQEIYLTAFINGSGNEKQPYLRVYLQSELKENEKVEEKPAETKKASTKKVPVNLF